MMKKVTAAIVVRDGTVLIARRKDDDSLAGHWEFPGGKIEVGETAEACLIREMDEELGLGITIDRFFCNSIYTYPKGQIELLAYLCRCEAEPTKLEAHSEVRWEAVSKLLSYNFAPADIPIVRRLLDERGFK